MTRVNTLILSLASVAALVGFVAQFPARAGRASGANFAAVPEALADSAMMPLIAVLATCCFAAMLLSTALHHRNHIRNAVGRRRSLAGELAWVAVPIAIVVGVAIPASGWLGSL